MKAKPLPKKTKRGRVFRRFILRLLLVMAVGLALYLLREYPVEIRRRFVAFLREQLAQPEASPTPLPKPVVQATPKPTPVIAIATPAPTMPPPPPDPLAWLLDHKARAPKEVTLRSAEAFPAVVSGSVVGWITVPAGVKVGLAEVQPKILTALFNGGARHLPYDATDILDQVKVEMKMPEPPPEVASRKASVSIQYSRVQPNALPAPEFVHPGVILSKANLREIENGVRSGREPWKSWFKQYDGDPGTLGNEGQFEEYGRNPDVNRGNFQSDMWQLYRMAMQWTVKKDKRTAERGIGILENYAKNHKRWIGVESGFMQGDCMNAVVAAEILRWTYPGWTEDNTAHITRYFADMWWDTYMGGDNTGAGSHLWTANQGTIHLKVAMEVAIFCDDPVRFNMCLNAFLTDPLTGLENSLPNGEVGDTGRDSGHWTAQAIDDGWICQLAWLQGIDLFAQRNYRMVAISEYLAQNQLYCAGVIKENAPYIPYGCSYDFFTGVSPFQDFRGQDFFEIIDSYARMHRLQDPFTHQLLEHIKYKPIYTFDNSSNAQPIETTWTQPQPKPVTGLESKDIGASRGSMSESVGVWTLDSDSKKVEDGYHFAYLKTGGDWTFIARVAGVDPENHGGEIMVTERLEPTAQVHATWLDAAVKGSSVHWSHGQHSYGWPWDMRYYGSTNMPLWLKLVRRGVFIYAFQSEDGVSWAPAANVRFDGLADNLYVGLATWGGRTSFDHVSFGYAPSSLPTAPADVEATISVKKSQIRWRPGPNTVFCDVLCADAKGGPYTTVANRVVSNSFTDASPSRGVTHYYVISPAGYSGRGPNSAEISVTGG
jgi:hypothetical protein